MCSRKSSGLPNVSRDANADLYFDTISEKLKTPAFRPRALFDRFNIEVLATTDSPLDSLADHQAIRDSEWEGRILPTFRPDPVVDPEFAGFEENIARLGELTGEDTARWPGYLEALRTDAHALSVSRLHGYRSWSSHAANRGPGAIRSCRSLRASAGRQCRSGAAGVIPRADADRDGAHEPGRRPGHADPSRAACAIIIEVLYQRYGRDVGADIPRSTNYVDALRPLLNRFGNEPNLTIILFTLDESTYSRELAPLAGHYPCLRLGPPWWFHDSPEGMIRFREQITESAGFYNTVGFNDDTRAFLSIPARHDVARRMDCAFLARLVAEHRLDEDEAHEAAYALTYGLVKKAYKLEGA